MCHNASLGSSFPQNDSLNESSSSNPFAKIHLDFDDQKLAPDSHAWLPNGTVLVSSHAGKVVVSFDPSSGLGNYWLREKSNALENDLGSRILEEEETSPREDVLDETVFQHNNFKQMVPLKKEVLFAGAVRL